ncbi:MAG TPA: hypothetical protein VK543_14165 [Puia sp.]|nr:hypothetical protein [Puia sp.]
MEKLKNAGRIIFAIGLIGLGVVCFIAKDFIVGRPPAWPAAMNVNPALAYISGTALIIAALAILFKIKGRIAALFIGALIFFLSLLRHIPHFMNDWANAYKTMALFGGALIVASSFLHEEASAVSAQKERSAQSLTVLGSLLLAVFFIACGYAHFKFADFVNTLIPNYIPFHSFWTYFCGICLFAGGLGLLIPQTRQWAALLSGIMVIGWFLLLHVPRFAANTSDPSDRMGFFESFSFAGIFFVLAGLSMAPASLRRAVS